MEKTYTMIGADGQHYGPVTFEQIKAWIAEGRVVAETKILRSDTQSWLPASHYLELRLTPETPAPVPPPPISARPISASATFDPTLIRRARSGATWFFWIAGLSFINTLAAAAHAAFAFYFGILGMTGLIDAAINESGGNENIVTVLNIIIASIYVLFGIFALKRHRWAFILGGIFYALDTLVFLLGHAWIILAFHVFVLFCIFRGWQATMQLKKLTNG